MRILPEILFIVAISCTQWITAQSTGHKITIQWTDHINGNFSFKDNWSYPEGVYRNQFGQLSCDGLCPPEIDEMKDENGKIRDGQLSAFYQLIDTTHQYHSIQSEAYTYEWVGTDFIRVVKTGGDSIVCSTYNNAATHSSLQIIITQNLIESSIHLNSIVPGGSGIFSCKEGTMVIDRNAWQKGILKAAFDFIFDYKMDDKENMWWKGAIYAKIENPE